MPPPNTTVLRCIHIALCGMCLLLHLARAQEPQHGQPQKRDYAAEYAAWQAAGPHDASDTTGAQLLMNLVVVHQMRNELKEALRRSEECEQLVKAQLRRLDPDRDRSKLRGLLSNALGMRTMFLERLGARSEAAVVARENLEVIRTLGPEDAHLAQNAYGDLILLYLNIGDRAAARAWSDSARRVIRTADSSDLGDWHWTRARTFRLPQETDSALYHLHSARRWCPTTVERPMEGDIYSSLIALHIELGNADSVAHYLPTYHALGPRLRQGPFNTNLSLNEGSLHYLRRDYRAAIPHLARADSLARKAGAIHLARKANTLLSLCYSALGDAPTALLRAEQANEAMREWLNPEVVRDLATQRAAIVNDQALELEKAKADDERRKRWIAWWISGGSLLLVGVILFSAYAIRQRNRALAAKNAEILRTRDELVRSERAREASELRTRIARDLHDEMGSELTRLALAGNELKRKGLEDTAAVPALAENIRGLTRRIGATMSDVVWAVDPARDNVSSLLEHAERFVQRMAADSALHVRTGLTMDTDAPISTEVKHNLFMVLKEAVNNAVKYAGADLLDVALDVKNGRFDLRIADDGKGFSAEQEARSGNGLRNMKARAEQLGATFQLITRPGQGTEVRLSGVLA